MSDSPHHDSDAGSTATNPEPHRRAAPLCLKCMTPYVEGGDLCATCGMPVSVLPQVGPVQGSVADVWFMGEAARLQRPSLVHVMGMWLLSLPGIALLGWAAFGGIDLPSGVAGVAAMVVWVAVAVLGGILLYRTTRNYLRARHLPAVEDE